MEHFKKRLIHQHQKPLASKLSPKSLHDDCEDDASSNSSTSSGSNINIRTENKKDGKLKIARKRAVCRSKFRHNSLKIFKLGTSIPTSLCKSKEPYNVSAEKNLQHCCENRQIKKKKEEKMIQKESITEQIINTIEGHNKKENFQRSVSLNLDCSAKVAGKHNLPPVVSEAPLKRNRNSSSRSSEDEQKISGNYNTPLDDPEQSMANDIFKPDLINCRRKTVTGTETSKNHLNCSSNNELDEKTQKDSVCKSQIQYTLLNKIERISPDSTFSEKETTTHCSLINQIYKNTPPIFTSNTTKIPHNNSPHLPINITLPQNTSITPIVSTKEKSPEPSSQITFPNFHNNSTNFLISSLHNDYVKPNPCLPSQRESTKNGKNLKTNTENPINLSVKKHNHFEQNVINFRDFPYTPQHKSNPLTSLSAGTEQIDKINKNIEPFPEIYQQISRLQNSNKCLSEPLGLYKSFEESIARSTAQMAYAEMLKPFSVENLIVLNYSYKKLQNIVCSKHVPEETIRNFEMVMHEIILYVNSNLFDNKSPVSINYTQQIMEFDLELHAALLKDVIHIVGKKCYESDWMDQFLTILSRNERKHSATNEMYNKNNYTNSLSDVPQTFSNIWPYLNQYQSTKPSYPPRENFKSKQNPQFDHFYKPWVPYSEKCHHHLKLDPPYNLNNLKNGNYPSDSRYIPPKPPIIFPSEQRSKDPTNKTHKQKLDKSVSKFLEYKKPHKDNDIVLKPPKINKKNDFTLNGTVIVKDESMEVTKGEIETKITKENRVEKNDVVVEKVTKSDVRGNKKDVKEQNVTNFRLDDLHLFKELLKQEDKKIYNRILNKLLRVKETVKEVITIEDEEDMSTRESRLKQIFSTSQPLSEMSSPREANSSAKTTDVVVIDDDIEDKNVKYKNSNLISLRKSSNRCDSEKISTNSFSNKQISCSNENTETPSIVSEKKQLETIKDEKKSNKKMKSNIIFEVTNLNQYSSEDIKKNDLRLDIRKPCVYKMSTGSTREDTIYPNYHLLESPKMFTPPCTVRPHLGLRLPTSATSGVPENVSPPVIHSPIDLMSSVTPYSNTNVLTPKPGINSNWKSWISEERKKGFLDARQPAQRRQSIETISSVGSDYSPSLDFDENIVKIKIDAKWYRVKKTVMESIPRGKLCYVREKNYLIRYFDDNQLAQFIQNMNINLVSPAASDFLKQIRDRYLNEDIFITPYEIPEKNEVIQLTENVSFTKDDFISVPELYVEEVEKVEKFVPKDFLGFYKFVTGYQIVNNHHPISFQTFLTMHNTNGITIFYKKYLLSILENKYV